MGFARQRGAIDYGRVTAPWMVPVPVRASNFVPLYPEHADYNVEVSLADIAPFGSTLQPLSYDDFLLCDLQSNPDITVRGRLGSGRAGVYRKRYVKGVGRTLLAGNWGNDQDAIRHHGMLTGTGAVREFLVSHYVAAQGAEGTINPCVGVLFKAIAPGGREYLRH